MVVKKKKEPTYCQRCGMEMFSKKMFCTGCVKFKWEMLRKENVLDNDSKKDHLKKRALLIKHKFYKFSE